MGDFYWLGESSYIHNRKRPSFAFVVVWILPVCINGGYGWAVDPGCH